MNERNATPEPGHLRELLTDIAIGPLAASAAALALTGVVALSAWYRFLLLAPALVASYVVWAWRYGARRDVRQAVHRTLVRVMRSRTRIATGSFVRGWHEGDEWNFEYKFDACDGRSYRGQAGTAWDMIHAAYSRDTELMGRFTAPGRLHVRYLVRRPSIHTIAVEGERLW